MSIQDMSASSRITPADVELFDSPTEFALNLRWSWNHATGQLWRELIPVQWRLTHHSWAVLQTISRERLQRTPCNTSGMKVLVNGGLNVSELNGWWAEAYRAEIGWARGDGQNHGGEPARDVATPYSCLMY